MQGLELEGKEGTHFFDEDSERPNVQSEEVRDNRERLVSLCVDNDLIMNTTFQKQDQYLAAYKEKERPQRRITVQKTLLRSTGLHNCTKRVDKCG